VASLQQAQVLYKRSSGLDGVEKLRNLINFVSLGCGKVLGDNLFDVAWLSLLQGAWYEVPQPEGIVGLHMQHASEQSASVCRDVDTENQHDSGKILHRKLRKLAPSGASLRRVHLSNKSERSPGRWCGILSLPPRLRRCLAEPLCVAQGAMNGALGAIKFPGPHESEIW
jgi:hypothetical protein